MNLSNEFLKLVATAAAGNEYLIAIHLSDNGIRNRKELFDECLDIFGLSAESIFSKDTAHHKVNRVISNPSKMRDICRKFAKSKLNDNIFDTSSYNKLIIQSKQAKTIVNNKVLNLSQSHLGIGRAETSMIDHLVFTRKPN